MDYNVSMSQPQTPPFPRPAPFRGMVWLAPRATNLRSDRRVHLRDGGLSPSRARPLRRARRILNRGIQALRAPEPGQRGHKAEILIGTVTYHSTGGATNNLRELLVAFAAMGI